MSAQGSFFDSAWKVSMGAGVIDRDPAAEAYQRYQEQKRDDFRRQREAEARQRQEQREHEERQRAQDEARQRNCRHAAATDPRVVLGVAASASKAEIRAAWVRLVKQHHPDTGGNAAKFREVQVAYERLK